jgi:EmrB/QacA subfamily drug resistance transporter
LSAIVAPDRVSGLPEEPNPRRWLVLAIVLVAECMDLLDGTIVNVAMPSIRRDLGGSNSSIQWIAGGYALAFAATLITGARLGDINGRRRLFLIGAVGFTVASAACAAAPSVGALIAFRLLQGAAAGLMVPQGLAIIRGIFPTDELGKAFAIFGPVIGGAAVLGPILGGALIAADLFGSGWRLVFLINVPLGVLAIVGSVLLMPESRASEKTTVDLVGALLSSTAMVLLIYPLIEGQEKGWPAWGFALMAAALVVGGIFVWHIKRRERNGLSPLVITSVFAKRAYSAGLVVGIALFGTLGGLLLVISLFLQFGLGFTAIHAGLTMIPLSIGVVFGSALSGALLGPKYGRNVLHAGTAVMTVGMLLLAAAAHHWAAAASSFDLTAPLFVFGLGLGLTIAPFFDIVLASVDDPELGSASGVLNADQQLATALGVAIIGAIFFRVLDGQHITDPISRGAAFATSISHTLIASSIGAAAMFGLIFLLPKKARA